MPCKTLCLGEDGFWRPWKYENKENSPKDPSWYGFWSKSVQFSERNPFWLPKLGSTLQNVWFWRGYACHHGSWLKEHAVPPCLVLVIDDNLYGLMVALRVHLLVSRRFCDDQGAIKELSKDWSYECWAYCKHVLKKKIVWSFMFTFKTSSKWIELERFKVDQD